MSNQRLEPGTYSGSPILADGKIYAISEDGVTTVVRAGREFEDLGQELPAGVHAEHTGILARTDLHPGWRPPVRDRARVETK